MRDKSPARTVALMGLLFALAIVLSYLESLVPNPLPVPGIKLGLSNIVIMLCVFSLGAKKAWVLAVLKALFVLLVRGMGGAALSLSGGLVSVGIMCLLGLLPQSPGHTLASMAGAVGHNVGQLLMAAWLLRIGAAIWVYLPVLVASGVVMGALTSVLLRGMLPRMPNLN